MSDDTEVSDPDEAPEAELPDSGEADYLGQCGAKCPKCLETGTCTLGSKHADDGFPHSCSMHHTW